MAIPVSYNLRNLVVRKTTTIMTALGIALTVAVLLAVLGLVSGLENAFAATGDPLHILVLRKRRKCRTHQLADPATISDHQELSGYRERSWRTALSLAGGCHYREHAQR